MNAFAMQEGCATVKRFSRLHRTGKGALLKELLPQSSEFIPPNDSITERASELEKNGIMGMDALHVSCAEEAQAAYFVSCDDVLVKRLDRIEDLKVHAVGLLEFISREVF